LGSSPLRSPLSTQTTTRHDVTVPHPSRDIFFPQAAAALQEQNWIGRVFRGECGDQGVPGLIDLATATGGAGLSFEEFQHWSAVVS
jgi:hypothetical protein